MNRRKFLSGAVSVPMVGLTGAVIPDISFGSASFSQMAKEYAEGFYRVGKPTRRYWSVTGEPYVVLCYRDSFVYWNHEKKAESPERFIKREGEEWPLSYWAANESIALSLFKKAFDGYRADKPKDSVLYWRQAPTLEKCLDTGTYSIYARLLLSNSEEI